MCACAGEKHPQSIEKRASHSGSESESPMMGKEVGGGRLGTDKAAEQRFQGHTHWVDIWQAHGGDCIQIGCGRAWSGELVS